MRYLALLTLFFVPLTIAAAEPKPLPPIVSCPADIIIVPFKAEVATIEKDVNHLDDVKYYNHWSAYDAVTNKSLKITDLTDKQKRGFFLHQGELLHTALKETIKEFKNASQSMRCPDKLPEFKSPHTSEDVKSQLRKDYKAAADKLDLLVAELQKIHRILAAKRESLVKTFMEDYKDKDKQLVKELESYLAKMQKMHRSEGLTKQDEVK